MLQKVPPLTSDQQLTQLVENTAVELVGRENVLYRPAPTMGVEDFSWYTRNYNACMFYFGARNVEKGIITRGIIQSLILMKNVSGCYANVYSAFKTADAGLVIAFPTN